MLQSAAGIVANEYLPTDANWPRLSIYMIYFTYTYVCAARATL